MAQTWDWSIRLILWLQHFSPALDLPFRAFTFLGEEDFFIVLLPLLYWCLDRRAGARLSVLFLFSFYLSAWAKVLAFQPRPFQVDARVQQLTTYSGGGFPSAHTQTAVVVWGYLAAQYRRRWLWALAAALMILIPLSRLYLGVHFPVDVLGGYLIGAAVLALYLWLAPRVEQRLVRLSLAWQLLAAVLVPVALMVLLPTGEEIGVTSAAMLLGMATGMACERRWIGFEAGGTRQKQLGRLAVGVLIVLVLRFGLKAAFEGISATSAEAELTFRFVRYTVIGLWVALGAPWLFVRLRLAESSWDRRLGGTTAVTP